MSCRVCTKRSLSVLIGLVNRPMMNLRSKWSSPRSVLRRTVGKRGPTLCSKNPFATVTPITARSILPPSPLARLRRLCLALPEAHEVEAWGEPTFRVRNKLFAMYATPGSHHTQGRPALWCKAGPDNQRLMVRARPERFFVPPYVGPSGWVGVWLDRGPDWEEVRELLRDSWRMTAPKRLLEAAPRDVSPARGGASRR